MHTVVVVGHVDHGKSTLLGKLLSETGHVRQDKIDHVQRICEAKGIQLEPAFFLDALEEEQAQGISIDTTSINFEYRGERFLLIDAPGHIDFLKNMTSGASNADYGVLVIDSQEGIRAQTTRHLRVLGILGVNNVIVAINKMDRVQYSQQAFDQLAAAARELVTSEGVNCTAIVPMSAFNGENVVKTTTNMPWYAGKSLLEIVFDLCTKVQSQPEDDGTPFRMLVQDVYKFDEHRYFAGRILSGALKPGTEVCFTPSGKLGKIESIATYPHGNLAVAAEGKSVGLRLADQLFVERGEVVSMPDQLPEIDTQLRARIVWISSTPFDPRLSYLLKIGTKQVNCRLELSANQSSETDSDSNAIIKGDFADVKIYASSPVAFDRSLHKKAINKLVICDKYETVAAGVIDTRVEAPTKEIAIDPNVQTETGYINRADKEHRNGHRGAALWLTGLSGAGKSTLAKALEKRFFEQGCNVVVLDADNMRRALCADLRFSREDRAENIRRLANVAKLLVDNGTICIVAAISPYERDRELAASIIGSEDFSELFVFCPLEVCQQRDPKGLYKRVAGGQIESFTGVDLPYQPPKKPDLRMDTSVLSIEEELDLVCGLLRRKGVLNQ